MTKYTCRFLNSAQRIDDVETFDSLTDGLAQQRASLLLSKSEFPAIELWERNRLVFKDDKTSGPEVVARAKPAASEPDHVESGRGDNAPE